MDSEEDEESSNSLLALSGSLLPQAVNSTTPSFPTNSRQTAWLDRQTSELDAKRLTSHVSSLARTDIISANGAMESLGVSSNNIQKRGTQSAHYNANHQNIQYKESLKYNISHITGFDIRDGRDNVNKSYSWRGDQIAAYPKLSVNSESGHSPVAQVNRSNNKIAKTVGSSCIDDSTGRSTEGNVQNRLYFKKRQNDFQNPSSDVLYANTYVGSDHEKEDFNSGNEDKTFDRSTQVHSLSAICPADSSCEPSNSLQQSFASTALVSGRNPSQVSSSGNSHIQDFFKNQVEQGYTSDFTHFRSFKKSSENQEEPLTFDPKQIDGSEVRHDFDFSFGPRSFPSIGFGTDFSSQSKPNHQFDFHQVEAAQGDISSQTFFSTNGSSSTGEKMDESNFYIPVTLNSTASKKRMQGFGDFETSDAGQDLRIVEQSQRKTESHSLSTTLVSSLPGGYMVVNDDLASFKHQVFGNENQISLSSQATSSLQYKKNAPLTDENNSWMGRSRAHRKMARLLGTADMLKKPSGSNDSKQIYSLTGMNSTTFHSRHTSEQSIDGIGRNFSSNHPHSVRDQCNLSRDILTLEDDLSFKTGENSVINNSRTFEDSSERQGALNRELFTAASSTASAPNYLYQGSMLHNLSEGTVSHREPEFPIFSTANTMPRDPALSSLPMPSESKNLLDSDFTPEPIHKDSVVSGFMINSQHGSVVQSQQSVGCLDFASSQRGLELSEQFAMQDPKVFGMNTEQVSEHQINLTSFEQEVEAGQPELTLSDNLALGANGQQVLNLEAYFNPQPPRDLNMSRKLHGQHGLRDMSCLTGANENDFNFDDYMNPSTQRDAGSSYLMHTNLPQDMTVCQKPISAKMTFSQESLSLPKQIERQQTGQSGSLRDENQEREISELHKELTKTSTKEGVKGIRIPRDINRAMEILQSLQADEKEEHRKEQEWKRQQQQQQYHHQEQQHQQHQEQIQQMQIQHQQMMHMQQQQQQQQGSGTSLNSSPKKTFQNKHYFESLSLAMTDHQLLGTPENLIDDQTVGNFLDQSQLDIPDQSSDSLQMMPTFQNLPASDSSEIDSMATGQYTKRDLAQPLACELDYHILKRLALATSLKDSEDQQASLSSMTGQPGTTNLSSILAGGDLNSEGGSQDFGGSYYTPPKDLSNLQRQGDFEDVFKEGLTSKDSHLATTSEIIQNSTDSAGNRLDSDFSFADLDIHHRSYQAKHDSNITEFGNSRTVSGGSLRQEKTSMPRLTSSMNFDSVAASRKNMYSMMKTEQFCDAILSTSKETVKVHQVVLCSMSQYLSTLLLKMSDPTPSSVTMNFGQICDISEGHVSSKPTNQVSLLHSSPSHQHPQQQGLKTSLSCHANIVLVVNCDDIKASSLQTFLVYIYLGTSDLTEANVCDLYLLASSLKVNCLRDKCREFMQQEHISEDKLIVPELALSSSPGRRNIQDEPQLREEGMMDKACDTSDGQQNVGGQKMYEDKAVNTVGCGISGMRRVGGHMEVATQTDRSTTEAGVRGSQEEWVMLKKTKQKTVSPSKSKSSFAVLSKSSSLMSASVGGGNIGSTVGGHGSHGKLQSFSESFVGSQYHLIHKLGKKGWLSPKRRYKTELHQTDSKTSSTISGASKDFVLPAKEHTKVLSSDNYRSENSSEAIIAGSSDVLNDSAAQTNVPKNTEEIVSETIKIPQGSSTAIGEAEHASSQSESNVTFPMVVTKGTLVSATKTTRTTVEIAAEAAAAKVCAHPYGTRTARGATKNLISYAALASGNNRKKSPSSSPGSGNSKKKSLSRNSAQTAFQSDFNAVDMEEKKDVSYVDSFNEEKSASSENLIQQSTQNSSINAKCPLKKNIVHRSGSNEASRDDESYGKVLSPSNDMAVNYKETDMSSGSTEEGHVNSIDAHPDAELQKLTVELETEETSMKQHSSIQSMSDSELKLASQIQAGSSSSSQSEASSTKASKAIPQNFRKRLIHQINSEQRIKAICFDSFVAENSNKFETVSDASGVETSAPICSFSHTDVTPSDKYLPTVPAGTFDNVQTSSVISFTTSTSSQITTSSAPDLQSETRCSLSVLSNSKTLSKKNPPHTNSSSISEEILHICEQGSNEIQSTSPEVVQNSVQALQEDVKGPDKMDSECEHQCSKEKTGPKHTTSGNADSQPQGDIKHQGASTVNTDQEEELFTHKIFKRRKKIKSRKLQNGEPESLPAPKYKKMLMSDGEASSSKPRHRKAVGGSDTEGSVGRLKIRKTLIGSNNNSSNSNIAAIESSTVQEDGTLPKVRAPPKKRAKMELALLKAANLARRAIEERKVEPFVSAVSSPQKKIVEKEEKGEKQLTLQDQTESNETAHSGDALGKGENRSLMSLQKKVAKRKAISTNSSNEKLKAKSKIKTSKILQSKKKCVKSQPLLKHLKEQKQVETVDAAALIVSSLALKLKAKFKEHMSTLGKDHAQNIGDDNNVNTEEVEKQSFTKYFSCSLCQVRLKSARRMVKHVKSHGLVDDKILEAVCVGKFNQEYEACDICGYETKDKSYHYMHYHKHLRHGVPLPPGWRCDACKLCGRVFATAFQFKEHMLSHEQPLRFICWHCGQHFSSRSNFNSHVYHKHSDVRKHQCTFCTKGFKTRTQLKVHLRSHTGERPFKCPDCDYSSTTRGNMKAHLKSHNYPMDKINELIAEIAERASELDAKSVDEVMKKIAEKVKSGELPAAGEKKQGSSKKDKDKNKRKRPKSKVKKTKENEADHSVEARSSKSSDFSVLEPQSETQDAPKSKTSISTVKTSQSLQESHIKHLLTAPLSSLKMPTFQAQPGVIGKYNERLDTQSCKPDSASNIKFISDMQEKQHNELQRAKDKGVAGGTISHSSNVTSLASKASEKTEKRHGTSILPLPYAAAAAGANACQDVTGASSVSENSSESSQLLNQFPLPPPSLSLSSSSSSTSSSSSSSSSSLPLPSVIQSSQPFIIPFAQPGIIDQSQQNIASTATQQLQPPVQLLISPDFNYGGSGMLELQQSNVHSLALSSSTGNQQMFSGFDIANMFATTDSGQVMQAMTSADPQIVLNADNSQIIQVIAPDTSLTPSSGMGALAQNGLSQIIQLVGAESGGLPAANMTAPSFLHLPIQSNFLESHCLFQEMTSSCVLPVVAPGVSLASGLQDSGTESITLQMSLTSTGEEQFVQQVQVHEEETDVKQSCHADTVDQEKEGVVEDSTDNILNDGPGEEHSTLGYKENVDHETESAPICKEEYGHLQHKEVTTLEKP